MEMDNLKTINDNNSENKNDNQSQNDEKKFTKTQNKKQKKVNVENIDEEHTKPLEELNLHKDVDQNKKKKNHIETNVKIDKQSHSHDKEKENGKVVDKKEKQKSSDDKKSKSTKEVNIQEKASNNISINTKPKKRIFALTSYDEIKHEEKEKKETERKRQSRIDNFNLFTNNKLDVKEISSKHIIKMLLKENITTIKEEILVTLLRISRAGLSKQGMVCREFINAIKILIMSIDADPGKFKEELRHKVNKIIEVVNKLTYKIGGLDNSCQYIKKVIQKIIPMNKTVVDLKEALVNKLDEFINTKINTEDIISNKHGINLIKEGDCLLIYGKSQIYRNILTKAVEKGINFKVIYVDNIQNNHIKSEIEFLTKLGVNVTYSYVNGISGIIDKVTKVFIKAKSMLSNGNLLGEIGTSVICCIASNFKKPVIAFSETYKFWDKILMNSFQTNNMQVDKNNFENSQQDNYYRLKIFYDVTPANYINMVVCEHGYIPPTSVPVVIREFGQEEVEFE